MAGDKKAGEEGRTLVFIDEGGLSTRPTWAPRGQTPVIQETFGWKSLSIIGGLALYRFCFQIHPGSIKGPQVIEFLRHLQRNVPGKLTVIWDGAPIHRSRMVQDYLASTGGRIVVERLPAYAPELNPVEYMWGNLKTHQIGNLIATQALKPGTSAWQPPPPCDGCVADAPSSPPATNNPLSGLNDTPLCESQ